MRVLVLTHSYPRYPSDAPGNFVLRLLAALRDQGVESRVLAPGAPGCESSEAIDGIRVDRFRYAPRRYETLAYTGRMAQDVSDSWSARLALMGLLSASFAAAVRVRREFQPDVIHAHWWFPGGLVGNWVSKLANVPLVVTLHGSDLRLARNKAIGRALGRKVLEEANAVTTVSHWLAEGVTDIAPRAKPVVAPMPVATHLFMPGTTREHPRERTRFLFAGRLNAQKGVSYALRALAELGDLDVTLDIVGDSPERSEYIALAQSLGIMPRVKFHGQVTQDVLATFYQRAGAVLVPSIDEGLGLTVVEAQLCETPVIAFDSGGLPDVVQHDKTGLLVPPHDVAALSQAMRTLVTEPARADALGQAGRLAALAAFAPESVAQRYAAIYDSVRRRNG